MASVRFLALLSSCALAASPAFAAETIDLAESAGEHFLVVGRDANFLGCHHCSAFSADMDADGRPDLVVGASGPGGRGAIVYGPREAGEVVDLAVDDRPDVTLLERNSFAVELGDLDGDGAPDVVLGLESGATVTSWTGPICPGQELPGSFSVERALLWSAEDDDSELGFALGLGDLDGDGRLDLAAGAQNARGPDGSRIQAGAVAVVFAPLSEGAPVRLGDEDVGLLVHGPAAGARLGHALAVGDLDGDGFADLATGAYLDGPGTVHVFFGPLASPREIDLAVEPADATVLGSSPATWHGYSILIEDLDADGAADLVLGAPRLGGGAVRVVFGPLRRGDLVDLSTTPPGYDLRGRSAGDELGFSVGAVDLDGDGRLDLVAAAPRADGPLGDRRNAGEVHGVLAPLVRGSVLDLSGSAADVTVFGEEEADSLGHAVGGADLNGDGRMELIASTEQGGPRRNAGKVHGIFLGEGDEAPERGVCRPKAAGFWHRQCLGLPAADGGLDRGRRARLLAHPAFTRNAFQRLLLEVDPEVRRVSDAGACAVLEEGGLHSACARARRSHATLGLNIESGRLVTGAPVTLRDGSSVPVDEAWRRIGDRILAGDCLEALHEAARINTGLACTREARAGRPGGGSGPGGGGGGGGGGAGGGGCP